MTRQITALLAVVMMTSITACAGKDTRSESEGSRQASQGGFGEVQTDEGSTQVRTREKVTTVVERERDIPTLVVKRVAADLNRVNVEHLRTLGVPDDVAKNIVEWRQENDGFQSVEQLQEVNGMDGKLYSKLSNKVAVAPTG